MPASTIRMSSVIASVLRFSCVQARRDEKCNAVTDTGAKCKGEMYVCMCNIPCITHRVCLVSMVLALFPGVQGGKTPGNEASMAYFLNVCLMQ